MAVASECRLRLESPDFARNYALIALEYAEFLSDESNRSVVGFWMRLAGRRFLTDLKRAESGKDGFYFDLWHACDPCDFIEKMPHVEGTWTNSLGEPSPTIELDPSDVFFIVQLFGFRNSATKARRFTTAVKATARKNAKSTIAAAIGLYCQACEGEVGPQVISAATTGTQARVVFNIARRMVEMTEDLREQYHIRPYANAIISALNGGSFRPINSKASTQDGLNPSVSIVDEVHAHKNHDLINVIQSAAGARRNPLFLFATTEGYESPGPWPEIRSFCKQVLRGAVKADHFLCVYYAVDEFIEGEGVKADDDFDEAAWHKANPHLSSNKILLDELRKAASEARFMPGKLAEFRTKRLNRQSSVAEGWISYHHWSRCAGEVDVEKLKAHPCYGALDLASSRDMVALRFVWMVDGVAYTWGRRWVPENAVHQRTQRGTVPYAAWVEAGFLEVIPGEVIDHVVIENAVLNAKRNFNLKTLAYDPWNAAQLSSRLSSAGVHMKGFIQGPKSYHPAMKLFEELYISAKIRHGGDPILTWCASNLVVRKDVNENMAPDRRKSVEKIDDIVALLMAIGLVAEVAPRQPSLIVVG